MHMPNSSVVPSISHLLLTSTVEFDQLTTTQQVLLSHRYGSRPTPSTIRRFLFELLLEIIRSNSNDDDAKLLSQWYQLDTNQRPAAYVLRSISSSFSNILSPVVFIEFD
ncbi:unnamed protein product [Rotaria sp. Silwood1]|nr:unnamed protein product [Rotaria sp. Silwood1]